MLVKIIPPTNWYSHSTFELVEDIHVCSVTIPKGFVTDGVTLPKWLYVLSVLLLLLSIFIDSSILSALFILIISLYTFSSPTGKAYTAAVLHDYLLTIKPRKEADRYFLIELKNSNLPRLQCYIYYFMVRLYSILK